MFSIGIDPVYKEPLYKEHLYIRNGFQCPEFTVCMYFDPRYTELVLDEGSQPENRWIVDGQLDLSANQHSLTFQRRHPNYRIPPFPHPETDYHLLILILSF